MKRVLSAVLSALLLLSVICLAGCGASETSSPLKFGLGVHAYVEKATNADGDTTGVGQAVAAVAAVLLDQDGKVVKCVLDVADNTVNFTSDGKFVEAGEFKTKYEKGDAYGMKAYGGATKEWYEQADAFAAQVVGKTLTEIKAMIATNGKGTDDVINAGCTIYVSDFILSLEKAITNAVESNATKDHALKLGVVSSQQSSKNATADAAGMNEVDTTAVAAVVDKDGKVVAMSTDALQAQFAFDAKGATTVEAKTAIQTKKDKGANYGMAQYGQDLNGDGTVKEWFEQAQAFNAACVGKTASEITGLAINTGYGADSLQTAGCTIHVGDMVKAAVKAATLS